MFFAAFTSAMVVRRGLGGDWVSIPLPGILWWNTAILIGSSVSLEMARRGLRRGERGPFNVWWTAGMALGGIFLVGQYVAWQDLQSAGIYLATNPSSSFFYLLTVLHAIHVIGGVAALAYIDLQALRLRLGPGKRTAVDVAGIYWHFLAGLWIYLLLLFRFWG
jgi:cytochrome c oxidase subunit 3